MSVVRSALQGERVLVEQLLRIAERHPIIVVAEQRIVDVGVTAIERFIKIRSRAAGQIGLAFGTAAYKRSRECTLSATRSRSS